MRERLTKKRGWNKASAASAQSCNLPQGETAQSSNRVWRWDPPKAGSHSQRGRNKNPACQEWLQTALMACSVAAVELARWGFCVSCDDGSLFFLKVSTYFKKLRQSSSWSSSAALLLSLWCLDSFQQEPWWVFFSFFLSDKVIFKGETQCVGSLCCFWGSPGSADDARFPHNPPKHLIFAPEISFYLISK